MVYTNTKYVLTKVDTGYLFLLSTRDREKSICQAIRAIKSKCAYLVFSCTAKEVCVLCCSKTRHCKDHRAAQYRHFPHWHRPPTFFSASTSLLRKSGGSKSYPRGCADRGGCGGGRSRPPPASTAGITDCCGSDNSPAGVLTSTMWAMPRCSTNGSPATMPRPMRAPDTVPA